MSAEPTIDADEFARRLTDLCLSGGAGLPRRQRDLHILLASATLWMETGMTYREDEINDNLERWLETVCPHLRLDRVTLRRERVDSSYILRDDSGRHYTAGSGSPTFRFDPEVGSLSPAAVITRAVAEREARKRARTSGSDD